MKTYTYFFQIKHNLTLISFDPAYAVGFPDKPMGKIQT